MTDSPWVLVSLLPLPEKALGGFVGDAPVQARVVEARTEEGLRAALADAELVIGDWSGGFSLSARELAMAPRLAFVQQPSVGIESIDLDACTARGIPVANTAGANAVSVAEWCLGATLAVLRSLSWGDAQIRAGSWPQSLLLGRGSSELAGKRVGLVGFGPIGVACARLYGALGCPVSYWSRRRRDPAEEAGATYRELDDLLAGSDVLVVVIALGPQTRGLLGPEQLARLPAGAYVVSAGRGHILDEAAVAAGVAEGRLAGAAFDVYDTEPLPADSPLRDSDRVLLSPHGGGATTQAISRVVGICRDNVHRATSGEPVANLRNEVDPVVRRR